ncbi:MAG: amidohydrolase family protein [Clostridia bacterium]|nr:amidohydrolase family protein [Clostridia bacterium]
MIIDSHQHVMLPTSIQIEKMKEAEVDKTILFTTTPHVEKATSASLKEITSEMQTLYHLLSGEYSPEERIKKMKGTILELKQAIAIAPNRFFGFGAVPLGLSEQDTSHWIEKYVIQNSFKGIGEFTPGSEIQIRQLETIMKAVTDYPNIPIWVHTFNPVSKEGIQILMELCMKYPSIPVIFGHMGGSNWMDVIAFAKQQNNVYLDLSASFTTLSIQSALIEVPEKCLFGSDAPFGEPLLTRQLIEYVSPSQTITDLVLGENIQKLLQL